MHFLASFNESNVADGIYNTRDVCLIAGEEVYFMIF